MKRRSRGKFSMLLKICMIILTPAAAGAAISRNGNIDKIIMDSSITKPTDSIQNENTNECLETINDIDSMVLSVGYGYKEETTEKENNSDNLLNMASDDPGEKPYPSENDWKQGGDIIRTTFGYFSGTTYFDLPKAGQVNNKTDIPNSTLLSESKYLPDFTVTETEEPLVLIYHTHTTESFEPYVRNFFDAEFNYRTTDETKNMVMVGNEICQKLEEKGIHSIHATQIHDYPSYNGSYERSRETITEILNQNPSIKVVLDIHRDAIQDNSGAYQPFTVINGKEAAQIMLVSCCDDGSLEMPNYMMNFRLACNFQQALEINFPGLTRPILFDYRKYNQDLTTGSLLIEVGSHGNTLEQVQYSGQLIGTALGDMLNSLK